MKAKIIKTGEIVEVYHEPQHSQTTNIYKEAVFVNGRMWKEDELDFSINSESKEVDLEKEIEKYAYSLPHSVTGTTSYVSDIKAPIAREFGIKHDWSYEYVEQIAEHFFELGLKAQKGA